MEEYDKFLEKIIPVGFPVLVGGDTNVARRIEDVFDRTDAPQNKQAPSCTVEEQKAFEKIVKNHCLKDQVERFQEKPKFTWFLNPSFRYQDKGMRVDHVLANRPMEKFIKYANTLECTYGSDHRPNLAILKTNTLDEIMKEHGNPHWLSPVSEINGVTDDILSVCSEITQKINSIKRELGKLWPQAHLDEDTLLDIVLADRDEQDQQIA